MTTPPEDTSFPLTPPGDPLPLSPEDEVEAAVQSALAGGIPPVREPDPPTPLGATWLFDFETGQFERRGSSAVKVTGRNALAVWAECAARTPQYGYAVFTDNFGMRDPEDVIGRIDPEFSAGDYEARMRKALLVHDRISEVNPRKGVYDPTAGALTLGKIEITTDEGETLTLAAQGIRRA